jgi:hypothetical protein
MMGMGFGGRIVAGAILAAVALAVPSLAWGLKTRTATNPVLPGKATAKCGDGERLVSGGFSMPDGGQVTISRAAKGQRWTATADGNPPLTVFAYCTGGRGVSRHHHSETVPGPSGTRKTVAAHCDANQSLVSGGYETVNSEPGTHDLVAFKSRRAGDRTWKVTVFNDSDTASTLKVFAYCKRHVDVKARSKSDPVGPNQPGSATARCHRGETLLSGGYTTTPRSDYGNTTGPDLFYTGSYRSGRRAWTAAGHNYSDVAGRITTFVYCKQ